MAVVLLAQLSWVGAVVAADPSGREPPAPIASASPVDSQPSVDPGVAAPTQAPSPAEAQPSGPATTQAPSATEAPTPVPTPAPSDPAPATGTIGLLPPLPAGATELVNKRTETSRSYRDVAGKIVTESYTSPVFFRPSDKAPLEPIRLGYQRSSDGTGAVSDKAPLEIAVQPATSDSGFLQVKAGDHTITYRPLDKVVLPATAANAAVINGAAADVKDVIPGVDLRVLAHADTASVFFILDQAADAAKITFAIDAPGLTAVVNEDGQVVFSDASGAEVARMAHPWAMDSTPDTTRLGSGRMTGSVSVTIYGKTSPYTATVSVDQAWLKDAVYPVYLDPTLALQDSGNSDDAFVNAGNNIVYGEYCRPDSPFYCELWLGQSPSPTTDVGTVYMKWNPNLFTAAGVGFDSASLQIFPYHQWSGATPKNTWVWQVAAGTGTVPWTESSLKYSNRPQSVTGTARTSTTTEGSWSDIDIISFVTRWAYNEDPNYGVRIDENGNDSTYWKRIVSVEQSASYVHVPRIVYTSHTLGATPVPAVTVSPSRLLQWTYANGANKPQTNFEVDVATDAAFTNIVQTSGKVAQSVVAGGTGSWVVPSLTDLTKYWWRVRVSDGSGWSLKTAVSTPFIYDAVGRGSEPWLSTVPFDLGGGLGLDVAVNTGEARLSRSLYAVPTIGPAQGLDLTYSSLNVASAGSFGYGWSSNLTQTLWRNSNTAPTQVIWKRADGGRVVFTGSGTTWAPIAADHVEALTVSGTEWTVTLHDQTRLVFSLPSGIDTGKLARIEDRFGKQLVFAWGATSATVTSASASGVTTTLNYPGGSLITSVVDPAGRTWTLGYTGSDLTSITEPDPDGAGALAAPVTTIGYATHLATTVTRARRTAAGGTDNLVWTVGYSSGKVTSVIDPIANSSYASVASTFAYNAGNTVAALLKTYSPVVRNSTTFYLDGAGRATSINDPLGNQTTSVWNPDSTLASWTSNGSQTAYTYSTDGRANLLIETVDATGTPIVTKHDYNTSNDVIKTYTAFGSPDEVDTTFAYDTLGTGGTPGHLITVTENATGAQAAVTSYAYNANDQLIAEEDPQGTITTHTNDGLGNVTQTIANCVDTSPPANWYACAGTGVHDVSTNVTTSSVFTLASASGKLGLPDSSLDANGRQTTFQYDALGRTTSETPPAGQTVHEWDQLGNEVRTTAPGSQVTTRTYDLNNRVTTLVQPGMATTSSFDAAGSLVSQTVAGETTSSTYDDAGNLVSRTIDPGAAPHLNLTTEYAYDEVGREVASRRPAPTSNQADLKTITRTWYDAEGRVTKVVENCTNTATTIPDVGWQTCAGTGTKDATWNLTTTATYDDRGNKLSETAPNGRVTTSSYDALDRLIKVVDNDVASPTGPTQDVTTEYAYDANGNQTAVKSPTNAGGTTVTRTLYDNLGRATTTIANCTNTGITPPSPWQTCAGTGTADAATNIVTTYTYDAAGNQVSATGPDPSATSGTATTVTRYAYDPAGRLCRVLENASVDLQGLADPCATAVSGTATSNVSTRYAYDAVGNVASMIDGNGHTTNYAYDANRHMTSLQDALGGTALAWVYDDVANTKTQTNRTDTTPLTPTITWAYDSAGRVKSQAYLDDAGASRTTYFTYDNASNLATATDGTSSISVMSDRIGRPTNVSVSGDASATTTYGYSFTAPNRTDASGAYTMTVDPFGRLTSLTDPIHATPFTWSYGADGQPITAAAPNGNSASQTYDPLGRLLTRTTGTRAAYTYTYNRAGQRVSESSTITGDPANGTATFGYDALGRLTGYTLGANSRASTWQAIPNRVSLAVNGGTPVIQGFDAANRANTNGYGFDADGRMTNRPSASGGYLEWDSLGRLVRVRTTQGGPVVAQYTYDALDRLLTVERSGTRIRFRYQGTSTAVAQVVDDIGGSVLRNVAVGPDGTPLEDWLGSSRRIYGTNGHHDTTWTADDTGAVTATLRYDPWGNLLDSTGTLPDWRFQGSWFDTSTNLAWAIARWYDPALGSFVSEDSSLGFAEVPWSRHLYAYGAGDPVNGWDPNGLFAQAIDVIKVVGRPLTYFELLPTLGWNWMAGHFTTGLGAAIAPADSAPQACILRYLHWMVTVNMQFGAANHVDVYVMARITYKDGTHTDRGWWRGGSGLGIYKVPWVNIFDDTTNSRRYGVRLDYTVAWVWTASSGDRFPKTGSVAVHGTLTAAQRAFLDR